LLSVFNKDGIVDFAKGLDDLGFEILSTGGTAKILRESGLQVTDVTNITGHPECFDGRVKSLHPAIHAPLLARMDRADDREGLAELGYAPIQVVAVNLYDFAKAAKGADPVVDDTLLEMIDIGGPTLVRASAKNHRHVIIASDPSRYCDILDALSQVSSAEKLPLELRRELALAAFEHTATYDSLIANVLHNRWNGESIDTADVEQQAIRFPNELLISSSKQSILRYGENAHQAAALYHDSIADESNDTLVSAKVEGGKEMSYNNYADADACLRLCRALSTDEWPKTPHVCVIVKHNNPCGAALGASQLEAYHAALASDPESAFGSIICFNEPVQKNTAEALQPLFIEVLMAPGFLDEAKQILTQKQNRRLLTLDSENDRLAPLTRTLVRKSIEGGWLVQTEEPPIIDFSKAKIATSHKPTEQQIESMRFGVRVCEQVKSNAIVLVQGTATVGIGPGQTSRVEAVRIATRRAGEKAKGSILVSDAFFPFKDGIEQAAQAGISAIVQPGGSIRDQEVIDEADACGIAMLFTGHRLFRH
jgi:phosphoribosylaminoimidazolecarboxamide formyltransferase/IMP cyclohydrolase